MFLKVFGIQFCFVAQAQFVISTDAQLRRLDMYGVKIEGLVVLYDPSALYRLMSVNASRGEVAGD